MYRNIKVWQTGEPIPNHHNCFADLSIEFRMSEPYDCRSPSIKDRWVVQKAVGSWNLRGHAGRNVGPPI